MSLARIFAYICCRAARKLRAVVLPDRASFMPRTIIHRRHSDEGSHLANGVKFLKRSQNVVPIPPNHTTQ